MLVPLGTQHSPRRLRNVLINMIEPGTTANSVVLPSLGAGAFLQETSVPTCNAGIKLDNDGNIYSKQSNGGFSQVGTWLLTGAASGFYASSTIDSGTLDTDAGATFVVLSTDREYSVANATSNSERTTLVTLTLSSDVSGVPVVASRQYRVSALVGIVP